MSIDTAVRFEKAFPELSARWLLQRQLDYEIYNWSKRTGIKIQ
jgi:hypothetical protein